MRAIPFEPERKSCRAYRRIGERTLSTNASAAIVLSHQPCFGGIKVSAIFGTLAAQPVVSTCDGPPAALALRTDRCGPVSVEARRVRNLEPLKPKHVYGNPTAQRYTRRRSDFRCGWARSRRKCNRICDAPQPITSSGDPLLR